MKKLFPGYYRPTDDEFKKMWADGLFIFDTNVLLNLYAYPDAVRDVFLEVLKKIIGQSWIPYQVALEFHRNRFNRIKQSNKHLLELRDRVRATSRDLETEVSKIEFEKRNTGVANLDERLSAVRNAHVQLAEALDLACDRLPNVSLDDPIGDRLAELFSDNVGEPPVDQKALDALVIDGPDRYLKKVPPGFSDAKEKKDITYRDRELTYQAMFGDLILWMQVINHVNVTSTKDVIFITGDGKDDWWLKIDGKVLGPSPELVQEFRMKSGAQNFWMYRADQFLENAEIFLQLEDVTPEMIAQVKETSEHQHDMPYGFRLEAFGHTENEREKISSFETRKFWSVEDVNRAISIADYSRSNDRQIWPRIVTNRVMDWAKAVHGTSIAIPSQHPAFTLRLPDVNYGYEVILQRGYKLGPAKKAVRKAFEALKSKSIDKISIVIVLFTEDNDIPEEEEFHRFASALSEILFMFPITGVVIGLFEFDLFTPIITLSNPNENI